MRKFFGFVISLGVLVFILQLRSSPSSVMRNLPHPYSHVITVASDVDMQPPWYGHALHQRMNRDLGLSLSDSFWVSATTGAAYSSSLFSSVDELNMEPSMIEKHPIFWLLLREFHRGNIDHLHSWQSDGLPRFSHTLPEPIDIMPAGARAQIPRVGYFDQQWLSRNPQPASFRLIFDGLPPVNLTLHLEDASGQVQAVHPEAIYRGSQLQPAPQKEHIVEVLMAAYPGAGLMEYKGQPAAVVVRGASGVARLVRIEWDNFSRTLVKRQAAILERFNIRPVMSSSHGGFTRSQNLGSKDIYKLTPFGDVDMIENVSWDIVAEGDNPESSAFHTDILRRLGVISIADIPPVNYPYNVSSLQPPSAFPTGPFWSVDKTWGLALTPPVTLENLRSELAAKDQIASAAGVTKLLCTNDALCLRSEQGRALGYNIATSLAHVEAGNNNVVHNWYQHFGTALAAPGPTPSKVSPFAASVEAELWRLSNHAYNWNGQIPVSQRVWVPPAATWQNFRIAQRNLSGSIKVNEATSAVHINRAKDPILKRMWPNELLPTQELHGITVYVPDSSLAEAKLDNQPISSFTRNPADSSGRASITFVNDAFPITLIGPPGIAGAKAFTFGQIKLARGTGLRLISGSKQPLLSVNTHGIELSNISHIRLVSRITGKGRLWIRLHMESGKKIVLAEDGSNPHDYDARLQLGKTLSDEQTTRIIPLADIQASTYINENSNPPLPLGVLDRIDIGLSDAAKKDRIEIFDLSGLQPLAHAPASDGRVIVSGRATSKSGLPLDGHRVNLMLGNGRQLSTNTDSGGYYFFSSLERMQVIQLSVEMADGDRCAPLRGYEIWLARDEVELDVYEGQCG